MTIGDLVVKTNKVLSDNSPVILTALGVSGVVGTSYLAGKASYTSAVRLAAESPHLSKRQRAKIVWKLYIPAGLSGAVTIGCIVASNKVSSTRTAAAYSLLTVSEKVFQEYKEKVVEQLGEKKEQTLRDEVVQDRVHNNPPPTVVVGQGQILCCELYTGRYFLADMETLRRAENEINSKINKHDHASLSDLYYILGLSQTSYSSDIGWESGKLLELQFSTVLSDDNRPCIAFEYNYVRPLH